MKCGRNGFVFLPSSLAFIVPLPSKDVSEVPSHLQCQFIHEHVKVVYCQFLFQSLLLLSITLVSLVLTPICFWRKASLPLQGSFARAGCPSPASLFSFHLQTLHFPFSYRRWPLMLRGLSACGNVIWWQQQKKMSAVLDDVPDPVIEWCEIWGRTFIFVSLQAPVIVTHLCFTVKLLLPCQINY